MPIRRQGHCEVGSDAGAPVLTLLRHGESDWNRFGRFTGWTDVDLSETGRAEAARAGRWLASSVRPVECCFTSVLRRACHTAEIALAAMGRPDVPTERNWRLNERHYGALQGLSVWSAVAHHGPLAVVGCRRRFRVRPPALYPDDPRHPVLDPHYASLPAHLLPQGESVADTQTRLMPYWRERIVPELAAGRHVLVISHKHTLRALARLLHSRAPTCMRRYPLITGTPVVLRFAASDGWLFDPSMWADPGGDD